MKNTENTIITRFAPSPTGSLHIGSARTALFNFLFTKKHGGKMILRIEDTDRERSKKEYEEDILEGLSWLGITYDEFFRQSERGEVYKQRLSELLESGHAYVSEETGGARSSVIRFKNPGGTVEFEDLVRGKVSMDISDLGDFVLAKDTETPLYHLAVVVDDIEMGISHVIRGEDGIANTPRQILIQEALGAQRPVYAHIPLILAPDRSKLSKRHGAVSMEEYRAEGYLPEAIVNFLAFLGWNPGTEQELFTLEELIRDFELSKVQKGGAIFNNEKLDWYNGEYVKRLSPERLRNEIQGRLVRYFNADAVNEKIDRLLPILLERIKKFGDIDTFASEGEFDHFFSPPEIDTEKLMNPKEREKEGAREEVKAHLQHIIDTLKQMNESDLTAENIKGALWDYATEQGRGSVLWPMRFALSGRERSPDPFTLADILGKEETLRRLENARNIV